MSVTSTARRRARDRGARVSWSSAAAGIALAVVTALGAAGCQGGSPVPPVPPIGSPSAPGALPTVSRVPTPSPSPGPTSQRLAGERIVYSYPGLMPPPELLRLIRQGDVAGIAFFGRNIKDTTQFAAAIKQLNDANSQSPVHEPLLLMTDQEGGIVRRLPGPPDMSEKAIGEAGNPSAAAIQAGTSGGDNLKRLGLNVNLAPVLDVFSAPGDFADAQERSYSQNPNTVGRLGANFITAQQRTGVAATAKHFPGLGTAARDQNTDDVAVTLPVTLTHLRNTDEVPYRDAIDAGVKIIMVSWAVYPALDPGRPAGFSSRIVGQELRGRFGYRGVIITDALEAKALNAYGTPSQRAVDAARAGMDLILCSSGDVDQGEQAADGLATALDNGQLGRASFLAAVNRVNALRSSLG